ncbi:MAG: UDP-N-acetylenolpyruvoylglucosamine reductase [Candidatus Parcubacteria bacterium]|nr:MAG: UDP-N-acetylenolpyruvoylglucosamine reductase [Candidatus Parcubacteria bacterium]
MMIIPSVPLAPRTTLRVGGPAAWWVEAHVLEDIPAAHRLARSFGEKLVVMGEGANALVPDTGFAGVVLRLQMRTIVLDEAEGCVIAEGGAHWDDVVETSVRAGWWGLERLAGIPGTAGAAVVQNIGAYGVESSERLAWADIIHPATGRARRVAPADLVFSYRTSALKEGALRGWVVYRAAWRLSRLRADPSRPYAAIEEEMRSFRSPAEAASFIREVRRNKLPDLARWGTAGSFFQNPTLPKEKVQELLHQFPDLPFTPLDDGRARIALAWLLDKVLNLRGYRLGGARLYEKQPLVIAVEPYATRAGEVRLLAREVAARLHARFGFLVEPEVEVLLPSGFARCVWC